LKLYQFFGTVTETVHRRIPVQIIARNEEEAKKTVECWRKDDAPIFPAGDEEIKETREEPSLTLVSGFKVPFTRTTARLLRSAVVEANKKRAEIEAEERRKKAEERALREKEKREQKATKK